MNCNCRHADVMDVGWLVSATDAIFAAVGMQIMEASMPVARIRTVLSVGLVASALGLGMLLGSPVDARPKYRQQSPSFTQYSSRTLGVYRNPPPGNVVCWTPCGQPGSIVMGADPDPFIRSQILRDASGFFGGGGRS